MLKSPTLLVEGVLHFSAQLRVNFEVLHLQSDITLFLRVKHRRCEVSVVLSTCFVVEANDIDVI